MAINIAPGTPHQLAAVGYPVTSTDKLQAIVKRPCSSERDLLWVLPELGALWDIAPAASRQGGGGEQTNWRWPNGTSINVSWMASLEGLLSLMREWRIELYISMSMRQTSYPFSATVHGQTAYAENAWAAIIMAALKARMRPGMQAPMFLPSDLDENESARDAPDPSRNFTKRYDPIGSVGGSPRPNDTII